MRGFVFSGLYAAAALVKRRESHAAPLSGFSMLPRPPHHPLRRARVLARCAASSRSARCRIASSLALAAITAENRARAIADSSAEYVAWVDPDDWIDATQIEPILDALAARWPDAAAFSAEALVDERGRSSRAPDLSPGDWRPLSQITSPRYAHNLTIPYGARVGAPAPRRDAAVPGRFSVRVRPGNPSRRAPARLLRASPCLRYYWRQHQAQLHRTSTTDEHRRAIQIVSPALRAHTSGL